jgi:protein-L-isoaspartate(D-aspartate) O-methyltransferase
MEPPGDAPFDRILITAGVPEVARVLLDQLVDGGCLVAPVGSRSYQELTVVERAGGRFEEKKSGGCTFVPLIGQYGWEAGKDE